MFDLVSTSAVAMAYIPINSIATRHNTLLRSPDASPLDEELIVQNKTKQKTLPKMIRIDRRR